MYEKHPLLADKQKASAKALVGSTLIKLIYLDSDLFSWQEKEKAQFKGCLVKAVSFLSEEAKKENVKVEFFLSEVSGIGVSHSFAIREKSKLFNEVLKTMGKGGKEEYAAYKKSLYATGKDNIVHMIAVNDPAHEFESFAQQRTGDELECCVIYNSVSEDRTIFAITHELLHVYGAQDFYYDCLKEPVKKVYGNNGSVMLQRCNTIDTLTKYLIGWHKEPDEKAKSLLELTSGLKREDYYSGLKREREKKAQKDYQNKVAVGVGLNNIYEGENYLKNGDVQRGSFVEGVLNGSGSLFKADGTRYVGEFKGGSFHGKGAITYGNGDSYFGSFSNGLFHDENGIYITEGYKYCGGFVAGHFHGKGKIYGEKWVFSGEFKQGKIDGKGVFTSEKGEWKNITFKEAMEKYRMS